MALSAEQGRSAHPACGLPSEANTAAAEQKQVRRSPPALSLLSLEESQDALYEQYVPDALLEDWSEREDRALAPAAHRAGGAVLPQGMREVALRFMARFTQIIGLPHNAWFDVATVLDAFYYKSRTTPIRRLPVTCMAIIKILKKADNANVSIAGLNLPAHGSQLALWLQRLGFEADPVSEAQLREQEKTILRTLDWQIEFPSLEAWLTLYTARLHVLTQGALVADLNRVWEQSVFLARSLLLKQTASDKLLPRTLARALLVMNSLQVGLLSPEDLRKADNEASSKFGEQDISGGSSPTPAATLLDAFARALGCSQGDLWPCCESARSFLAFALGCSTELTAASPAGTVSQDMWQRVLHNPAQQEAAAAA